VLPADACRASGCCTLVTAITVINTTNTWILAEDPIKTNATQAIVHLGLAQLERLIFMPGRAVGGKAAPGPEGADAAGAAAASEASSEASEA